MRSISGLSSLFIKGQSFLGTPIVTSGTIPINLDRDKVLIEDAGDLLIFEAFPFHNLAQRVTPKILFPTSLIQFIIMGFLTWHPIFNGKPSSALPSI